MPLETECEQAYVRDMAQVSRFVASRLIARRVATLVLASGLSLASVVSLAATPEEQPTAAAPTTAKWVPRKVHFNYTPVTPSSRTTYLSCDKLQGQITAILQQLGARDEVVTPFGCFTVGGVEKLAGVDATFSVLEPAAGSDNNTNDATSKHVEAHWDRVNVGRDTSCELMKQVQRSILPLFTTRNESSGCPPRFSVDVLRPVKAVATNS
jgi:hypothetical protein